MTKTKTASAVTWAVVTILPVMIFVPFLAYAQDTGALTSQGPCKNISAGDRDALGNCIKEIYKWSLGIGVLLALLMIIFSGYLYMTAVGNAQRVTTAKELFTGAFIGLIILLAAVIILRTINPELVNFPTLPT